ncbi:ribbon-helix-helix protein, CopG family [Helicobacter saguini]|uniref:Ribbon-helix-helix protein, CopG family n=1 Tax=Helicobacter saguini TaxID=1548018 RepID=A0A347VN73_9HELI|nr:CopG family transcriptional regulator [Helicobacter saguini]MWV61876.1 ribbon-helix-helix protein, CopG family [Helicobacter saguini]MWV67449.1 ribbon-helix-helix protein, CopG family [Helicobacter saguini]MWV69801.1 ribbon-helix-helix protein, CopG family [Helicobacter saguini]MWV72981.1 ribbon-helix-helix protein, CopG family [Helicobacter saguini]TLD95638.1 ribbon-helix-helix protein, CopG family [Helicobacter saguini]
MKKAINISIDKDVLNILDNAAKEIDMSRSKLIEYAILAYQDKMDEMIADKRLDDIASGKARLISFEEFKARLGWK